MDRMCQCGLHVVSDCTSVCLHMRRLAAEPRSTAGLVYIRLSVYFWNDLADPVLGVGLSGFKSKANTFLLA